MLTERERKLIRRVFREVPRRRRGPKGYADWEIVEVVLEGLRLGARGIRAVERMQKWRGKGPMPSAATLSRRLRRLSSRIWMLCRILSRTRAEVGAVDATGIRTRVKGSNWGWSSNYKLYQGLKVHSVVAVDGCVRDLEVSAANLRESDVYFRGTGLKVRSRDGQDAVAHLGVDLSGLRHGARPGRERYEEPASTCWLG